MALEFVQTEDGPQKLSITEDMYNKMSEEEKKNLESVRDKGLITSVESEMGGTIGTVPKETETVNEKEEIKTKDGKFEIDISGALSNVGSSTSAFIQGVGSNLSAIAEVVPNKIDEIAKDPYKCFFWYKTYRSS